MITDLIFPVRYLDDVWSDLLGTPLGGDDNFFDLVGHSMLAVQMANRVARDTGVRIKLMRLGMHRYNRPHWICCATGRRHSGMSLGLT